MNLTVKAATDLGLKRAQNEDSFACWIGEDPEDLRRGALLIVADGMGGSRAGEVASQLAVEAVVRTYRESPGQAVLEDLARSFEAANRVVHEQSLADPELKGMGTTCTAVVVREHDAYLAHVGDSRAYVLRAGHIRQLTRDHSLVAQLVQSRQITPEQARVDPRRNLVTRSVGVGSSVEVDAERIDSQLRGGDTLLLCTDGLHGLVGDEELADMASGRDLDRACRELIALARQRGGPDNITLILARVEPDGVPSATSSPEVELMETAHSSPPRDRPSGSLGRRLWLIGLILAAAAIAVIAWALLKPGRAIKPVGAVQTTHARPATPA